MSFHINTSVTGIKKAKAFWRRLEAADKDRRPLADDMGQMLVQSAVHRLAVSNESPDGTAWQQSERAKLDGGKTQFVSGMAGLAGSLLHEPDQDGVDFGSPLVYALQRQLGGTILPKNGAALVFKLASGATVKAKKVVQPGRPYLGVSPDDAVEMGALAADYYADAARGS